MAGLLRCHVLLQENFTLAATAYFGELRRGEFAQIRFAITGRHARHSFRYQTGLIHFNLQHDRRRSPRIWVLIS